MVARCLALLRSLFRRPGLLLGAVGLLILIGLAGAMGCLHLWAESHFRAAQAALEHHGAAEARQHLQFCLRVWPFSVPTHLLAARAARLSGDFEEAEQQLEECKRLRGRMSEDLVLEWAMFRAQTGEVDSVFKYCQDRIDRRGPEAPLVLEALAQGYIRNYRYAEAGFCLEIWVEREPDNPEALYLRGWVKEQRNLYEQAVDDYRRVVELQPERRQARVRLINCLLEVLHVEEAAQQLEPLLRDGTAPTVEERVLLARCRHQQGQSEEAAQVLDDVLARDDRNEFALVTRGQVALQAGESAEAERFLRRALELVPGNVQARYALHQALEREEKYAEAREEIGRLKSFQADSERMRQIVIRELEKRPHDPDLLCEGGKILLRGGLSQDALIWLYRALKEDPRHRGANAALAEYYQKIGNREGVAHHRQLEAAAPPAPEGDLP